MILAVECIVACLLFAAIMVGGVYWKREAFLHEYAPAVQQRYFEQHPGHPPVEQGKMTLPLLAAKVLMALLFTAILTGLIYLAGARTFWKGAAYAYIIWFVVNWFDVVALDMGVFAYWKKLRLPGTEDMDGAYTSNAWKHVKDGFFGTAIGIPIAALCGWLVTLL